MIRFTCSCGRLLQARPEHAGRRVACPACGARQVVPGEDVAVQPAPAPGGEPRVRQAPPAQRPDDEERPRRRRDAAETEPETATSGKAIFSFVLGLLSVACGCTFLAGLPALVLGFLALRDVKASGGRTTGGGLAIGGIIAGLVGIVVCTPTLGVGSWWAWDKAQEAGLSIGEAQDKVRSRNNLKQIGLAFHNYHDSYGHMPGKGIAGPTGRPLRPGQKPNLSWRVALLPFLEQNALYKRFRLDEPWDSPHNKQLIPLMPKVYELPGKPSPGTGMTYYQVFTGPNTPFDPSRGPTRMATILDGTVNTILAVEAADAVIWTKPDDLEMTAGGPIPPLGGHYRGGFHVLLFDGSVHWLPQDTPSQTLRAAITPAGGEPVFLP
jgi:hypothetical protein